MGSIMGCLFLYGLMCLCAYEQLRETMSRSCIEEFIEIMGTLNLMDFYHYVVEGEAGLILRIPFPSLESTGSLCARFSSSSTGFSLELLLRR